MVPQKGSMSSNFFLKILYALKILDKLRTLCTGENVHSGYKSQYNGLTLHRTISTVFIGILILFGSDVWQTC